MTNETLAHQAALKRWMCQLYNARGGLGAEAWKAFKHFCETNGYTDEPPPGQRMDGRNTWDVFEKQLLMRN